MRGQHALRLLAVALGAVVAAACTGASPSSDETSDPVSTTLPLAGTSSAPDAVSEPGWADLAVGGSAPFTDFDPACSIDTIAFPYAFHNNADDGTFRYCLQPSSSVLDLRTGARTEVPPLGPTSTDTLSGITYCCRSDREGGTRIVDYQIGHDGTVVAEGRGTRRGVDGADSVEYLVFARLPYGASAWEITAIDPSTFLGLSNAMAVNSSVPFWPHPRGVVIPYGQAAENQLSLIGSDGTVLGSITTDLPGSRAFGSDANGELMAVVVSSPDTGGTGQVTTFEIRRVDFSRGTVGESLYSARSSQTVVYPNRRDLLAPFGGWRADLLNGLEDATSYSISPPAGSSFTWSRPLAFGTEIAVLRDGADLVVVDTTGSEVSRIPSPIGERSCLSPLIDDRFMICYVIELPSDSVIVRVA